MNNYPIKNSKYTGEIKAFPWYAALPVFNWGQKIYGLFNDGLHAVIPVCSCAARTPSESGYGEYFTLIGAKIAGREGVRIIKINTPDAGDTKILSGIRLFATIDDYHSYLGGADSEMRVPCVLIKNICEVDFGLEVDSWSSSYCKPVQWGFSKSISRPRKMQAPIKAVWIDDEGSHLELMPTTTDGVTLFSTEKECRMANIAPVYEFDDEPKMAEEQEWNVELPTTVRVKAKTEEEAKSRVNDALHDLVNA